MALGIDLNGYSVISRVQENTSNIHLVPADIHAEEFIRGLRRDREFLIELRSVRSPAQHRWFFAMLKKVQQADGRWPDIYSLLDAIKIAVGHVQPRQTLGGEIQMVPKSISFGSMDQIRFGRFVRRAAWALAAHMGIDGEELMRDTDKEFSQPGYFKERYGGYLS